jgi:hypothetical protein
MWSIRNPADSSRSPVWSMGRAIGDAGEAGEAGVESVGAQPDLGEADVRADW